MRRASATFQNRSVIVQVNKFQSGVQNQGLIVPAMLAPRPATELTLLDLPIETSNRMSARDVPLLSTFGTANALQAEIAFHGPTFPADSLYLSAIFGSDQTPGGKDLLLETAGEAAPFGPFGTVFAPLSLSVRDREVVFGFQAQAGKARESRVERGGFELAEGAFDSVLEEDGTMVETSACWTGVLMQGRRMKAQPSEELLGSFARYIADGRSLFFFFCFSFFETFFVCVRLVLGIV